MRGDSKYTQHCAPRLRAGLGKGCVAGGTRIVEVG